MIAGWLVKIVLVIALLGFAALELGSPLWTRAQLDGVAHDAADEAARVIASSNDFDQANAAAAEIADQHGATLVEVSRTGPQSRGVRVTVFREARSYLLDRFGPTKDWYDVTVDATAIPPNN